MSKTRRRNDYPFITGEYIDKAMTAREMTVPGLAKALGVSTSSVLRWLRNDCVPRSKWCQRLLEVFAVTPEGSRPEPAATLAAVPDPPPVLLSDDPELAAISRAVRALEPLPAETQRRVVQYLAVRFRVALPATSGAPRQGGQLALGAVK